MGWPDSKVTKLFKLNELGFLLLLSVMMGTWQNMLRKITIRGGEYYPPL